MLILLQEISDQTKSRYIFERKMQFGLSIAFVVVIATCVNAGGVGSSCSTSLACTVSNSVCQFLFTKSSCRRGACACKDGYGGNICVPTRPLVGYNGKCTSRGDCELGLTCTNSLCKCATTTFTYRSVLGECISPTKRALGEVCSDTSECYNFRGAYYGQTCTSSVGCRQRTVMFANSDTSRQTEVCPANGGTCGCPTTADSVPITYAGMTYVVCLQKTAAVLLADGAYCTTSNQCDSKICSTCMDGTSTLKCVRPGRGGSDVIVPDTWSLVMLTVVTLIML